MPAFFQKLQAFNKPQRAKYNVFIHLKLRPTPDTVSVSSLTMGMEIVSRASSRGDSQTTHGMQYYPRGSIEVVTERGKQNKKPLQASM